MQSADISSVCNMFYGLKTSREIKKNGRQFPDDTFKCIFLNENIKHSIKILHCSQGYNHQSSSFGSDNGLVPARQQAIIWANDG